MVRWFALAPLALVACGAEDIASPAAGTYTGDIVAGAVIETDYAVTVTAVDADTIEISGADFANFTVDLVAHADMDMVTNAPSDTETTLDLTGTHLSFDHVGAETVTFDGDLVE